MSEAAEATGVSRLPDRWWLHDKKKPATPAGGLGFKGPTAARSCHPRRFQPLAAVQLRRSPPSSYRSLLCVDGGAGALANAVHSTLHQHFP